MDMLSRCCRASACAGWMAGLLLCAPPAASAQAPEPGGDVRRWSVRVSGVVSRNTGPRVNWYTLDAAGVNSESAANGTQGADFGLDAVLEYRAARRLGLGLAVGHVPTRLHAEVHWTGRGQFARPRVRVPFVPLRARASFALVRTDSWDVPLGVQVGTAVLGSADVVPEFGRARRFEGRGGLVLGGHAGVARSLAGGRWCLTATAQYLRTEGFDVSELHTGALPQHIAFTPLAFHLGLERRFGSRGR